MQSASEGPGVVVKRCLGVLLACTCAQGALAQFEVVDPRFEIVDEIVFPAGFTSEICDIHFTDDGSQAFIVDDCEDSDAGIWRVDVLRDGSDRVTGFAAPVQLNTPGEELDAGLVLAPNGQTLFTWVYDVGIGQLVSLTGAVEVTPVANYDPDYGGLDLLPSGPNAGDIVHSDYDLAQLYRHSYTPDGDDSYTVDPVGVLYADFSGSLGSSVLGDVLFPTRGPLAGNALLALYNDSTTQQSVAYFPLGADGEPADGVSPALSFLVSGNNSVWGLAQDPLTGDLWLVDYGADSGDILFTVLGETDAGSFAIPALGVAGQLALACLTALVGVVALRSASVRAPV
jgi:hypothetical protein